MSSGNGLMVGLCAIAVAILVVGLSRAPSAEGRGQWVVAGAGDGSSWVLNEITGEASWCRLTPVVGVLCTVAINDR